MGDRVQMQQVVLNLVMNGIEAMVVSRTRHRCLSIISKKVDDKDLVVTVSDTGIGLPDDKHIFDVFFTTKQDGIGIGLSICRSIVESHRGRIWASPNKPAGTSFHFTIPIYQGERA
jgi:signal transduction histidine kinase